MLEGFTPLGQFSTIANPEVADAWKDHVRGTHAKGQKIWGCSVYV